MAYAARLPIKTARFANVAFSNGSLPAGFLERLFKRQPWSCPLGIKRFFVSPIESGELCLMASVMGESGDIVFPKLDESRDMIPFDRLAVDLLHALGMQPDVCRSEGEAQEKMREILKSGSSTVRDSVTANGANQANHDNFRTSSWPVYFFESDTSGEKPYEEFYVPGEELDMERFVNLGVVRNAKRRTQAEIDGIFASLRKLLLRLM